MDHDIDGGPAYATLDLHLEAGEQVVAEAGSMLSHTDGIEVETNATGGFLKSLSRGLFGGESVFRNTFTAVEAGTVSVAPPLPGDVAAAPLDGGTLYVQSGSYLASHPAVRLDTEFGGSGTFFGGAGLFLLRLRGTGPLYLSSYGAIRERVVGMGETLTVDTGHVVAFEEGVEFTVQRVGGLTPTLLGGEGLVVDFTGEGRVWLGTRSPGGFLSWLSPKLPYQPPYNANRG